MDDFAESGVKSVSLVSDGESTLSKAYVPFIQHASNIGIDIANATNGWEFEKEKVDLMAKFISENKHSFKSENLIFSNKLKK